MMVTNMGEFMSSIWKLKIKTVGFIKLHYHDLNAHGGMILEMDYKHKLHDFGDDCTTYRGWLV